MNFFLVQLTPQDCFILTPDYKTIIHREIDILVAHRNYDYEQLWRMPIFSRKYYINTFIDEKESEKEAHNNAVSRMNKKR